MAVVVTEHGTASSPFGKVEVLNSP